LHDLFAEVNDLCQEVTEATQAEPRSPMMVPTPQSAPSFYEESHLAGSRTLTRSADTSRGSSVVHSEAAHYTDYTPSSKDPHGRSHTPLQPQSSPRNSNNDSYISDEDSRGSPITDANTARSVEYNDNSRAQDDPNEPDSDYPDDFETYSYDDDNRGYVADDHNYDYGDAKESSRLDNQHEDDDDNYNNSSNESDDDDALDNVFMYDGSSVIQPIEYDPNLRDDYFSPYSGLGLNELSKQSLYDDE
jgi:hypothetical protein